MKITITVDHVDPRLKYGGEWDHGGIWHGTNGQLVTFSSTTDTAAHVSLSSVTVQKGVQGNISYYGFKQPTGGKIGICVDCRFFANNVLINPVDPNMNMNDGPVALYFGPSDDGSVILTNRETLTANSSTPFSNMTFVSFEFVVESPVLPSSTATMSASSSSLPLTTSPVPYSESIKVTPLAPLIGGLIGGFILLTLVSLLLWNYFVSRRRKHKGTPAPESISDDFSVRPFGHQYQPEAPSLPGNRETTGSKSGQMSQINPYRTVIAPSKHSSLGSTLAPTLSASDMPHSRSGTKGAIQSVQNVPSVQPMTSKAGTRLTTQSEAPPRPRKFDRM